MRVACHEDYQVMNLEGGANTNRGKKGRNSKKDYDGRCEIEAGRIEAKANLLQFTETG